MPLLPAALMNRQARKAHKPSAFKAKSFLWGDTQLYNNLVLYTALLHATSAARVHFTCALSRGIRFQDWTRWARALKDSPFSKENVCGVMKDSANPRGASVQGKHLRCLRLLALPP